MKTGNAVYCRLCERMKCPIGRSQPLEMLLCSSDCPGYYQDPQVSDLWPNEIKTEKIERREKGE
jgi:hypothetical protein